jgi:hypothetical protein
VDSVWEQEKLEARKCSKIAQNPHSSVKYHLLYPHLYFENWHDSFCKVRQSCQPWIVEVFAAIGKENRAVVGI